MDSQKGPPSQGKISFVKKNRTPNEKGIFNYLHLLTGETVTEKMQQLCRLSSLTEQDLKDRNSLLDRVLKCLQPYYPNCQVFMYGSTNNGFGTQGCDMDILFLPTPDYCWVGGEEDKEEKPPTLSQVKNGEFPLRDLEKMGEKAQLLFISRIFKKHFRRTIFIPARCPILNFMGVKGRQANICCDLTCRNKLVVFNTELLKFFGGLDSRVIPLVMTLRWWAKSLMFIKEAALSSYAFTLMIIFFLQNTRPSILPSVNSLMDLSESSTYVAGWPISFRQDKCSIPQTTNQDTEEQLLEKFFEFYWNFEFERYAVCVRTGKPLPLEDLKTGSNVVFQITNISIQDPFDLSHNVGKNFKHPFPLKPYLFFATDILTNNTIYSAYIPVDKFPMLFDHELLHNRFLTEFYYHDTNDSTILVALDHEILSSLSKEKNVIKSFYSKAAKAVFHILCYGFLMDCEIIDLENHDNLKSSVNNDNLLLSIQCIVYDRVWINRKVTQILDKFDCDEEELKSEVLKTERAISQSIIELNPHLSSPKPILGFHCNCFKTSHPQMPYLIIHVSSFHSCTEFKKVKKFLKLNLCETIKQIFSENKLFI